MWTVPVLVSDPQTGFASSRAKDLDAAAGEAGCHLSKRPVCMSTVHITGATRWIFKPDVSSDERLIRLRQRGTFCFFFTKNWLSEPIFRKKDLVTSALPEANRTGCPGRCLVWNRPRNSCHIAGLRQLQTRKDMSPPAGRKKPSFFTKIFTL